MAEVIKKDVSKTTASGAVNSGIGAQTPRVDTGAKNVVSGLKQMLQVGVLNTGLTDQLQELDEKLRTGCEAYNITSVLHTGNVSARVFARKENLNEGFAVIYDETKSPGYCNIVGSALLPEIRRTFTENGKFNSRNIRQFIIIKPQQYDRFNKLLMIIANNLIRRDSVYLDSLDKFDVRNLKVTIDPKIAMAQVEEWAIPAIMPRADIGFTVSSVEKQKSTIDGSEIITETPIFSVLGYVEFHKVYNPNHFDNTPMFRPTVTITAISSQIPNLGILPLALSYAADIFIASGGWMTPFQVKPEGNINIGALIRDDKGKPVKIKSSLEFNDFVFRHIAKNAQGQPDIGLAIELATALPEVEGVDYLVSDRPAVLAADLDRFFQVPDGTITRNCIYAPNTYSVILGAAVIENQVVDSRYLDYIKLAESCKSPTLEKLLGLLRDDERVRTLQELIGGISVVDMSRHIEFSIEFLNQLIEISCKALRNEYTTWVPIDNVAHGQGVPLYQLSGNSYTGSLTGGIY